MKSFYDNQKTRILHLVGESGFLSTAISSWALLSLIFFSFFILYLLTFTYHANKPLPDFWTYGADSYRVTYRWLFSGHAMAVYQTYKHPFYAVVTIPLYNIGRVLFYFFDQPFRENLNIVFPVAFLGAVNLCVAFAIFIKVGFRKFNALLIVMFYGVAGSIWYVASFPETYILTSLLTNIYLWFVIHDPYAVKWKRLLFVHALSCFSTPQQLFLIAIPFFQYIKSLGKACAWPILRYGAALFVVYVIPFFLLLDPQQLDFPAQELGEWASFANLLDINNWIAGLSVFAAFSQIVPNIQPQQFAHISYDVFAQAPWYIWLITTVVFIYAALSVKRQMSRQISPFASALLFFIFIYLAFFVYYNPSEVFLHAGPIVLPIWLLLHAGYTGYQETKYWKLALILLVTFTFINNGLKSQELREYGERNNQRVSKFIQMHDTGDHSPGGVPV